MTAPMFCYDSAQKVKTIFVHISQKFYNLVNFFEKTLDI